MVMDKNISFKDAWVEDFEISTRVDTYENSMQIVIIANTNGLKSLANIFLKLSKNEIPPGYHIHLDDLNSLEDNSVEIIFEKM